MLSEKKRRKTYFKLGNKLASQVVQPNNSEGSTDDGKQSESTPQRIFRLDAHDFKSMVKRDLPLSDGHAGLCVKDSDGATVSGILLRPKKNTATTTLSSMQHPNESHPEQNTMRLVHVGKTAILFEKAHREHSQVHPACKGLLRMDTQEAEKRQLVWRMGVKCLSCSYTSAKENLYNEVHHTGKGRKAATSNVGLAIAATHTSLGPGYRPF